MTNIIVHFAKPADADELQDLGAIRVVRYKPAHENDGVFINQPRLWLGIIDKSEYDAWFATYHNDALFVMATIETNTTLADADYYLGATGDVIDSAYTTFDNTITAGLASSAQSWVTTNFPEHATDINATITGAWADGWTRMELTKLMALLASDGMQPLSFANQNELIAYMRSIRASIPTTP